jgi:tRNA(Glu) U13 pseudouridine synthase TruD
VTLGFTLGRGQFATAVLREICDFHTVPELDSADD